MVCNRCIEAVAEEFAKANVSVKSISLGKVTIEREMSQELHSMLERSLARRGFELLKDQNQN